MYSRPLLIFAENIVFLVIIAVIFGSLLSPVLIINPSFTTSESGEGGDIGGSNEGGNDVLQATIIAAKQVSKLAGQSITTMVYNGSLVGPTLRASPGDRMELKLVNSLDEPTNLHFHGLHVSPSNNSDNVFREVGPGETANYIIEIPLNHPPGTFWYHSHQHGLSYKQVSNGLSGLIVIDGLIDLLPESLQDIKQQTLAMRDFQVGSDPMAPWQRTVNGQINPEISIEPGETQLWRLANIGSETFYNIVLPGHVFHVIAEDGVPVWRVWDVEQLLLPSGKRYDVLVTGSVVGHILSQRSPPIWVV